MSSALRERGAGRVIKLSQPNTNPIGRTTTTRSRDGPLLRNGVIEMEEQDYTGKGIEGLEFDDGFIEISWDEWRTRFLPIPQPDTGDEFWDYGPPAWNDRLREQDPACFWTLISEGGLDFIHSGFRVVNRLGYYITTVPVPENVLIQVFDEPWSPEQVKEVLEVIRRCQRDTDCPEEIVDIAELRDWLDSHYPPDSWLYEICEWWELIYHYFGDVFDVEGD